MALDYRAVTIQQAARIIGCSEASVRTLVKNGQIGVMHYVPHRSDGRVKKMLSQEDVELVAEQRSFSEFGMKYRGVAVMGSDTALVYAASSALGIAGFRIDVCATALGALSCNGNERPIIVICPPIEGSDLQVLSASIEEFDSYCFMKPEELRPLVRWAWEKVKARHESLKP